MPSIGVLEHYQDDSERPQKHVKRSNGQLQVRRGVGFWIIENVLLKLFPPNTKGAKSVAAPARYDGPMPSHKAPGTCVEGPLVEKIPKTCARILIANMIAAD